MPQPDDRELIRNCLDRDESAWREFTARFTPDIHAAAQRVFALMGEGFPRPAELDDIVSEVLERLVENDFQRLHEFRWNCSLRTWVSLVTARHCRNRIRDESRRRFLLQYGLGLQLSPDEADKPSDSPSNPLETWETTHAVREALARLSDDERTLLADVYLHNSSYREIARRESLTTGGVSSRIQKAKKKLLSFLEGKLFSILL